MIEPTQQPPQAPRTRAPHAGALIPGILIMIMGLGFLLSNFGLIHFQVWCMWPLILMAVGFAKITQGSQRSATVGLVLVGAGALFLLQCFGWMRFDPWKLWPLLLIVIGVRLLIRTMAGPAEMERRQQRRAEHEARRQQRREAHNSWREQRAQWRDSWRDSWQESWQQRQQGFTGPAGMVADQWMHVVAVFTEERRRITNPAFLHAEAVAVFGSCQIDLRGIGIPDHPITVDANAVFGGIEIFIPPTWDVLLKGVGIFGAYQDETLPAVAVEGRRGQLVVRGVSSFGGVSVKN